MTNTPAPMTPEQLIDKLLSDTMPRTQYLSEGNKYHKNQAIQAINDLLATTAKEARIDELDKMLENQETYSDDFDTDHAVPSAYIKARKHKLTLQENDL